MGRLTARNERGEAHSIYVGYLDIVDKLADYEDKEEQGLLIELPVAIDTEVWRIIECSNGGRMPNFYELYKTDFAVYMLPEWGIKVFSTRSEAEEALAKMGGK